MAVSRRHSLASLALAATLTGPLRAQVAVIVNHENPVRNLALDDLRRLYLGDKNTFPNGWRVTLISFGPLHKVFYQSVLGMSSDLVQRHWMAVVFRGEDATPPRTLETAAEVRRYVAEHRGAIAFINLGAVDESVRSLTIDGRPPTDPNYRLRQGRENVP